MDTGERSGSGLTPMREVSEASRRKMAWLAVETESSEEEALDLMVDAAKEIRTILASGTGVSRSLAGVVLNAAALFQLLRELCPGGLPMADLAVTSERVRIRGIIERIGKNVPKDDTTVTKLLEILVALEGEGISLDRFQEVARDVGSLCDLKDVINSIGGSEERISALDKLGTFLESVGVSLEDVEGFVSFHLKLQELNFCWESARVLAESMREASKANEDSALAARSLLELARRGICLKSEIRQLTTAKTKLESDVLRLRLHKSKLAREVAQVHRTAYVVGQVPRNARGISSATRKEMTRYRVGFAADSAGCSR